MDISPSTLENLTVTKKIRFKKVLGSYYYNREDLQLDILEQADPSKLN